MGIELINEPREFTADELFFSTTDSKGRIKQANRVFQRIAGYSWDELQNKPHNIIRHPDMPRVVFQLLWNYIQQGKPIVAIVKNLAHDGRYYWVVALVAAISDGYLSVRFKPTSPLLKTVKELYAELRAIESAIEDESHDKNAAMAASKEALQKSLRGLGFGSYDDFMRYVLKQEMQSREAAVALTRSDAAVDSANPVHYADSLRSAAALFDRLLNVLNALFNDLEGYVEINKGVQGKSENLTEISESLRVSALNGAIAVDKLGGKAAGLRPVLNSLRVLSGDITREGGRLSDSLGELVRGVDAVVFGLCAAKLQIEMTAQFAHELAEHLTDRGADSMTQGAIGHLHESSRGTVRSALSRLAGIKGSLRTLTESQSKLLHASHSLRPIYLTGKIELAAGAGNKILSVFKDLGERLEETEANLDGLKSVLQDLESHLVRGLSHGERVEQSIAEIDREMHQISKSRI